MNLRKSELKEFLNEKADQYNRPEFIDLDPISIRHQFSEKGDIEIAGFLAATIAWGNRTTILRSARRIMGLMDNSPYDFILNHRENDLDCFNGFVHRTFNAEDLKYSARALKHVYSDMGGLEKIFGNGNTEDSV